MCFPSSGLKNRDAFHKVTEGSHCLTPMVGPTSMHYCGRSFSGNNILLLLYYHYINIYRYIYLYISLSYYYYIVVWLVHYKSLYPRTRYQCKPKPPIRPHFQNPRKIMMLEISVVIKKSWWKRLPPPTRTAYLPAPLSLCRVPACQLHM